MADKFITEDFLLQNKTARKLYHDFAENMPIYDFHCHLPVSEIAADRQFENLTQLWLDHDHYKFRASRANGIDEKYITGDGPDEEKFQKWAYTVPYTLRNPLYHWSHLELKRYFGINNLLNPDSAKQIYDTISDMLKTPEFSVRNLIRKMNVKLICTTEDPLDSLEYHKQIREDGFETKVYAAFRPDAALQAEDIFALNKWIDKLEAACDIQINSFSSYIEALKKRHDYFNDNGCCLSDYDMETVYCEDYTAKEIEAIFAKVRNGKELNLCEKLQFKSAVIFELALMDHGSGWVMQLHIGALRNNCARKLKSIGPNCGCDSIGDFPIAKPLAKFLDRLDTNDKLAKTVIYNINPADNELIAAMIGNFQDGTAAGKIQFGPAWWFMDQKDGIGNQINTLSNIGLLSRFIGMTTDSRSFLSFPRHEYFRRILCNTLGSDIEVGLMPCDTGLVGKMVEDICFNNAGNYFPFDIKE